MIYHDQPDFDETGPFMSNKEVMKALQEYEECSFDQMPSWLQQEVRSRHIVFKRRDPSPQEMEEAEQEHFVLRQQTNQQSINDLWRKYK